MATPMSLRPSEIQGAPARNAALKLLDAVLRRGETLDQSAAAATQGLLTHSDKALARALASEVLRWLADLDALIDSATKTNLPEDAKARSVLRIMLAGWLRLETPPHAVVATGLPLLNGGPRRLAHGVFSTLVKKDSKLPAVPTLPDAVRERWGTRADAIAAGLAVPPPLDVSLRHAGETERWATELGGVSLAPGHVRLARGSAIEQLPGFEQGAWWVQDFAATLPARLLGAGAGKRVLDLCAAPGGKTLQLAAADWRVTALDISAARLELLHASLERTGLAAEVIAANAHKWQPATPFDAILLDAPCTATGTCRRHPDVLHRIGPRQIGEMAEVQQALLARAVGWLAPGGRLVYSVCSLEAEEGATVAATCPLAPDPIIAGELPAGLAPTAEGHVRTDPGMLVNDGGLDGFFIARFRANG
jgi:16S rRNA (cytosine967-C5)-methyltransferase